MAPKPARAPVRPSNSTTPPPGAPVAPPAGAPTLTWAGEVHAVNTCSPRCNGAAFLDGNRIMCVGGWAGGKAAVSPVHTVQQLDLGTLSWSEMETSGEPHPAPSQFSGVDVGGALLFFGGWTGSTRCSDLTLLQLDTLTWTPFPVINDKPPGLTFHTATLVGRRMYVFGGNNAESQSNDMHFVDLQVTAWATANNLGAPSKRSSHTATVLHDHHIVIFGGRGEGGTLLNDVAVFDASPTGHWIIGVKVDGAPPPPRYGHSAAAVGTSLLIFGGIGENGKMLNDLWMLRADKPNTLVWHQVQTEGPPPLPRAGHIALESMAAMYVVHGRTDHIGTLTPTVWTLETGAVAPIPVAIDKDGAPDDAAEKSSATPGGD